MEPLLGAHMSISGGLDQALQRGKSLDCATVQLFTKNASQWKERVLRDDEIKSFRRMRKDACISPVISHSGYLINLASPDPILYRKSIEATCHEIERCELLGIEYLVVHPGSCKELNKFSGLRRVVDAMDDVRKRKKYRVKVLLETTAGQGTYLGSRLEDIAYILNCIKDPGSAGFCVDTCHVFAAGYDLRTEKDCEHFFNSIQTIVGLDKLKVIHLNDSLKECGSKRDRHAHIGQGEIGEQAFRWIMKNPLLENIPKIIETPKKDDMDRVNLRLLRGFTVNPA